MKKLIFIVVVLSLMIWYCGDWRPKPKTGEVVFNIPSFFWKNIDEVVAISGDTSFKAKDDLSKLQRLQAVDYNNKQKDKNRVKSSTSMRHYDRGTFEQTKDGWTMQFTYHLDSRKIESIWLGTNEESHSPRRFEYNRLEEMLLIGNLSLADSAKYEIWFTDYRAFGTTEYKHSNPYAEQRSYNSLSIHMPGAYIPHHR